MIENSPLPSPALVVAAIRRAWPRAIRTAKVHPAGWTNLMVEVDSSWMVRVPRWRSGARALGDEARLLEYLEDRTGCPIPAPELIGILDRPRGWPFLAYRKLPGTPLRSISALDAVEKRRLAKFLDRLLSAVARCPPARLRHFGLAPGDPGSYGRRFRRLRSRYRRLDAGRLPPSLESAALGTIRETLRTLDASRYRPVLLHGDLWPNHILWDARSGRPSGVIDWEDARLGDPAGDLTALEGLGPQELRRLGEARRASGDRYFWRRLALYRRVLPLWGYLYGVETGNRSLAERHRAELRRTLVHGSAEVEQILAGS